MRSTKFHQKAQSAPKLTKSVDPGRVQRELGEHICGARTALSSCAYAIPNRGQGCPRSKISGVSEQKSRGRFSRLPEKVKFPVTPSCPSSPASRFFRSFRPWGLWVLLPVCRLFRSCPPFPPLAAVRLSARAVSFLRQLRFFQPFQVSRAFPVSQASRIAGYGPTFTRSQRRPGPVFGAITIISPPEPSNVISKFH